MRRVMFVLGLAAALTSAAATTALAGGGGISVVKNTTTPSEQGPSTRTATCAKQDQVLGGGFSAPVGENFAQQSKPDGASGWTAETLSTPGEVTAYAVCEKASARKVKLVSESIKVAAGTGGPENPTEGGVTAKCDKGWQVISGGYAVSPPYPGEGSNSQGEIAVDTSKRTSARGWKVHGGNQGRPTKLIAYALCEKDGESKVTQVSAGTKAGANAPLDALSATAKCPKGWHALGGGFKSKPDEAAGNFPDVNASMPTGSRSWKSTYLPQAPGSITSYAECEKG